MKMLDHDFQRPWFKIGDFFELFEPEDFSIMWEKLPLVKIEQKSPLLLGHFTSSSLDENLQLRENK